MAVLETVVFKQEDLVLKVSNKYDPTKLNLSSWDEFLDSVCGNRLYQKEAIKTAIIYLASGQYDKLADLARENFSKNAKLQEKYRNVDDFERSLQLPNKLYASIELATGTGKSYVMYAIAQIMLGTGLIDRVLVLCPSLTIEDGLTEKFKELAANSEIRKTIPKDSIIRNPRIVNANSSVVAGDICVENIHAVYEATGSSIEDSFFGTGQKTLVLNDEAHHIFSKNVLREDSVVKKWKEFLNNPDYDFKYMLGFTGTAYIDDEYFADVIYRYSLRTAIDQKIVKNIDYVREDDSKDDDERFEKIYSNHLDNKKNYREIKPISILVTKDINAAESLRNRLIEFLVTKEKIKKENAQNKVLIVTSSPKHKQYLPLLKTVDSQDSSYEWIVSVSMLTEGWDVKNVFQIVPWEDRAFNSKLLVAQVLGRGLRIPEKYQSPQPTVIVFNHKNWSSKIKKLVEEVLEIETKLRSNVISSGIRVDYNFTVHNIKFISNSTEVDSSADGQTFDFSRLKKEGIALESQVIEVTRKTSYESVLGTAMRSREYALLNKTWTIEQVIDKLFDEFEQRDWEGRILKLGDQEYTKDKLPPRDEIKKLIEFSMKKRGNAGDEIVEANVRKILTAFTPILRKRNKTITSSGEYIDVFDLCTESMSTQSMGIGRLRKSSSVFYSNDWENEVVHPDNKAVLQEVIDDESLPRSALKEENLYIFKTPIDIVFTESEPERRFVEMLCRYAEHISAWIKSRDQGFYEISYSYRYGSQDSKTRKYRQGIFNPDFIIKVNKDDTTYFLVVEIKDDDDVSEENIAKYKYGLKHFKALNDKVTNEKYLFHFLSPNGYQAFFKHLESGSLLDGQDRFRCDLENQLEQEE